MRLFLSPLFRQQTLGQPGVFKGEQAVSVQPRREWGKFAPPRSAVEQGGGPRLIRHIIAQKDRSLGEHGNLVFLKIDGQKVIMPGAIDLRQRVQPRHNILARLVREREAGDMGVQSAVLRPHLRKIGQAYPGDVVRPTVFILPEVFSDAQLQL